MFFSTLKILSRTKLLTYLSVSGYWTEDKSSPLISGRPLCKPGLHNQALHAKATQFYESARSAPRREKPQLPHQQPSQHDIFPPTSMCGERRWGGRAEGEETSWHGRSLSLKKMWRNQNAEFGQKTKISEKTAKKLKYKTETEKTQLNVKQHTDSMNVLRHGALKYWDYIQVTKFKNFTLEPRLGKTE